METTQAERDAYTREAILAFPTLNPLEATLALALREARQAEAMLGGFDPRKVTRNNR